MKSSYLIAALITLAAVAWIGSGMVGPDGTLGSAAEPDLRPPEAVHHEAVAPQVRVQVLQAQRREEALALLGETQASRRVKVKTETDGRVIDTPVEEGAAVTEGTELVRLALDDRMDRLDRAEAMVARWTDRVEADESLVKRNATSRQNLMESKASLASARADLAAIQLDIARTQLVAPFDGVLETRLVEVGDYMPVGEAVAEVVDLDPITVVVKVTERDVAQVTVGQPGTATLVTGRSVQGRVSYVAKVADGITRTFAVELDIPNPDGTIPVGMTAKVRLPLTSTLAHRISPAVLSLDDAGKVGVKLVDAENRVVFYPVTVTGDDADGLWIEGLPDPATLITVGQEFVRPGQEVRPVTNAEIAAHTEALVEADQAALEAGHAPDATIDDVEQGDAVGDGPPAGSALGAQP